MHFSKAAFLWCDTHSLHRVELRKPSGWKAKCLQDLRHRCPVTRFKCSRSSTYSVAHAYTSARVFFKPEVSVVLWASDCWHNVFSKCWCGCSQLVGSAVPLASDITKALIKLSLLVADSPLWKASEKRILSCHHLCVLLTGDAPFSRLEKVTTDGALWLFCCRKKKNQLQEKQMKEQEECLWMSAVSKRGKGRVFLFYHFLITIWWKEYQLCEACAENG